MNLIKGRYYHLSLKPNLQVLKPCIPNVLNLKGDPYEEHTIPRVSFSNTLEGCLIALPLSSERFKTQEYVEYYVYCNVNGFNGLTNKELIVNQYVYDSRVSGETWALEDTAVMCIGTIHIYEKVTQTKKYRVVGKIHRDMQYANNVPGYLIAYIRQYKFNHTNANLIKDPIVYHGSPHGGLKTIHPSKSETVDNQSVVFAGERWLAVCSCGIWTDRDLEQGSINGVPYLLEKYADAFNKVYPTGGYLYFLSSHSFKYDPRIMDEAVISLSPVVVHKEEYIPDPLLELERLGVKLLKHGSRLTLLHWS
jgi:hypothetical protein